jgi:hypothetical protein
MGLSHEKDIIVSFQQRCWIIAPFLSQPSSPFLIMNKIVLIFWAERIGVTESDGAEKPTEAFSISTLPISFFHVLGRTA